ncbi:MAG: PAS domain-containing protein [Alphaproteobacteria bacterium]|nr:PAS domain-containing protein [Alphaproteobacteria bacterium]
MKNPILLEIMTHWERLRAGRIAPLRSEIDPRQIENALEYAFILERTSTGQARFRIAGMHICDLMNMEVRGMPATTLIDQNCRARYSHLIERIFLKPVIMELELTASYPSRPDLRAELLLLPMKCETGEVSRILGCLVADGQAATPPNRFAITGQKTTRIIARDHQVRPEKTYGFAEPASRYVPAPSRPSNTKPGQAERPGYLRLITTTD